VVNKVLDLFDLVVATQDWHPADHESFASNHPHGRVGQVIDLHGLDQVLWPDHCVQHTPGAGFASELDTRCIQSVFQKGTDPRVDSYSGFFDNGKKHDTGLSAYLKARKVDDVFIVGLATDYCVKFTALDAAALGFRTSVILDAVRPVNLKPDDQDQALHEMEQAGVKMINSYEITN
jgi:nicotinamidase/pyrazinamidase